MLERTRKDTSVVGSQALRIVLDRRVESRRIELENLSRSTSVIVQNPSTSTPDPSGVIEDPSVFFGSNDNSVIAEKEVSIPKVNVIPPPFEIYQDSQYHIPVIETPSSISVGQENIDPEFLDIDLNHKVDLSSNMDNGYGEDVSPELLEKLKLIKTTSSKVRALTEMYDPQLYSQVILKRNEPVWLKSVEDAFSGFMSVVIEIVDIAKDSDADQKVKKEAEDMIPTVKKFMQEFLTKYNNKVMSIPSEAARDFVSPTFSRASSNASSQGSVRAVQVSVEIDQEKLNAEIKALNNELKRVDNWTKADSAEVEYAMSRIQSWRKMFKSIQDLFFNIKKVSLSNYLDRSQFAVSEDAVKNIEAEMEMIIQDIEYEDENRALYSLCKSKSADVKYPSFSGGIDEDFAKFKRELLAAFRSNKVQKSDQVKKLRENLKSQPLAMIADNMEDIDEALSILNR